ncbi:type II transport protein GspH [Oxalobacteraceae bacterium]|nr:type II transport protein GspH [Oxalobacteraceae bacterium]
MRERLAGASLIELMLALTVGAVLCGAAVPSYQQLLARSRLRSAVNELFSAIDLTRSQAIGRGGRVELAPLDPAGAQWKLGWVVFVDRDGNGRPDPDEEHIFTHGPVAEGIDIRANLSSGAPPYYIAYNGAGRSCAAGNSQAAHWGTLSFRQGAEVRQITVNMLGRARICDPGQPGGCAGGP